MEITNKNKGLLSQLCGHFVGEQKKYNKPVNYILAGNGLKERRENEIGVFVTPVEKAPGLDPVADGFHMKLPRLPIQILWQIIGFFRSVNDKMKTEVMVQVFWNREKKVYFIYVPKQEVSSAHVDFTHDKDLERKHLWVADIHSHNTMGASFSGTDDKDEKAARIYGVIGKIDEAFPEMSWRISSGHGVMDVDLSDVFDVDYAFPKEWNKNVTEKKYDYKGTTYYGSGYGYGNEYGYRHSYYGGGERYGKAWDDEFKRREKERLSEVDKVMTDAIVPQHSIDATVADPEAIGDTDTTGEHDEMLAQIAQMAEEELTHEDIDMLMNELNAIRDQKEREAFMIK